MYLGLDLGTSSVKALLMDDGQRIVASASADMHVTRPHSGWSEQDPAEWITGTSAALDGLKASNPAELAAVTGIGLSGHQHGATLIDKADQVLRPCILWNDTRSFKEAAELDGNPAFHRIAGNIVFPGFTAPKLVWVKNHEPEVFGRVAKALLPKDYLRLWLTGEHVSEMSDASGTAWLDVGRRRWSDELLAASGMRDDQMPRLVEGSAVSGVLRAELAARYGMSGSVVVAGGAGDNAASAIGMGTVRPDAAFVSLGTSGVLFVSNAAYAPNPASAVHAFCHAIPNTWHQMGVILSATDALNWQGNLLGRKPAELTAGLGELEAPSSVVFLPYLSGERTPVNDANIRGAFIGLEHVTGAQDMTRAILNGVAFAFRDSLEALKVAGTLPARVTAVGGGAKSRLWLQAIATVLNLPVDVPADGDFGAAFGAARLGMLAATGLDPLVTCMPPSIAETIDPNQALRPAFEAGYQRYRKLYPAIKGI